MALHFIGTAYEDNKPFESDILINLLLKEIQIYLLKDGRLLQGLLILHNPTQTYSVGVCGTNDSVEICRVSGVFYEY